jgi:flagellar motor switch protein FliN/FliY
MSNIDNLDLEQDNQALQEMGKLKDYERSFNDAIAELEDFVEIPIRVNVLIGQRLVTLREMLDFTPGSLLVLNRSAGESLLIYLEDTFFAKGEVTILEDTFAVRITEINDPRKV